MNFDYVFKVIVLVSIAGINEMNAFVYNYGYGLSYNYSPYSAYSPYSNYYLYAGFPYTYGTYMYKRSGKTRLCSLARFL